jgi:hypothetical protein
MCLLLVELILKYTFNYYQSEGGLMFFILFLLFRLSQIACIKSTFGGITLHSVKD